MMSQMLLKMCLPCGAKDELMLDLESNSEFISVRHRPISPVQNCIVQA